MIVLGKLKLCSSGLRHRSAKDLPLTHNPRRNSMLQLISTTYGKAQLYNRHTNIHPSGRIRAVSWNLAPVSLQISRPNYQCRVQLVDCVTTNEKLITNIGNSHAYDG